MRVNQVLIPGTNQLLLWIEYQPCTQSIATPIRCLRGFRKYITIRHILVKCLVPSICAIDVDIQPVHVRRTRRDAVFLHVEDGTITEVPVRDDSGIAVRLLIVETYVACTGVDFSISQWSGDASRICCEHLSVSGKKLILTLQ